MDPTLEVIKAFLNLTQVNAVLRGRIGRDLEAGAGIGLSDVELLRRLAGAPERRLRMKELADQLYVAQSGVTRVVDRLVAQGWVAREQPPDDRRTVYARLTDSGASVVARALPVYARAVNDALGAALSGKDVDDLRRGLRLVLEHLGAWDAERCDPPETTLRRIKLNGEDVPANST